MYGRMRKTKTGIIAAAFLLAAALMGCARGEAAEEQETDTAGELSVQAGSESGAEDQAEGEDQGEPQEALPGDNSGTDSETAGVGENQNTAPTVSPKPSVEPFVDKLTDEGVDWGLGFGAAGEQPVGNASREELAQYEAYFMGSDSENVIYLTFDCGYENGNTEAILDALKAHDAQGTFFVVGHYLESASDMVIRMVEEGHAVGNHTYHHYNINTMEDKKFEEELQTVEEKFREITGEDLSPYYRPPEGKCGITNLKAAQAMGYHTIFWSLAYVDWDEEKQPSRESALDKLTSRIHPGAVVLLHNTSSTNGKILDELLTRWEEMGYTFEPLSHLTQSDDQS